MASNGSVARTTARSSPDRLFRDLLDSAPDAMVIVDESGAIVLANRQAESLFGHQRAAMVGSPIDMLVPHRFGSVHPDHRKGFFAGPSAREMGSGRELYALHADGYEIPVEISLSPLETEDGTLVSAAIRDTTDRRAAEKRFRDLLDSAPDAMVIVDESGAIVLVNEAATKMFGYSRDELLRGSIEMLVPDSARGKHTGFRKQFSADPHSRPMGMGLDLSARRKDGTEFPVEISLSPLETDDGKLITAAVRDVTEYKRVEELRIAKDVAERARDAAVRANAAKSEFISRVSHELRTPLNAILGFGQLLELDELTESQRESAKQILKAGRHLLDLVDEILDLSRVEAGRMTISREPVHLGGLIAECNSLIARLAEEIGVTIHTKACDPPELHVLADQQRLKQILLNLLSNAIKYNRRGGTVTVCCGVSSGGGVCLQVRDTGIGMSSDQLARAFEPFDRMGAERSEVAGTGLGLALTKRLVEVMDGSIRLESTLGAGTTAHVELEPADAPAAVELTDEDSPPLPVKGRRAILRGRCFLYIEDNPASLRFMEKLIGRIPDARLIPAMKGKLGFELAREHHPDLVMLDLHLPDTDGASVMAMLRSDPATRGIPIVVVSADATRPQIERLEEGGIAAYLTKPVDVERLLDVLARELGETHVR